MALKSVDELKLFFRTKKKPTQQQFWDWLESFVHKTDGMAIDNVAGLVEALANKADDSSLAFYAPITSRMISLSDTAFLAAVSRSTVGFVLVKNIGICQPLESGAPADYTDTFPSADPGWLWELVLKPGAGGGGGEVLVDRSTLELSAAGSFPNDNPAWKIDELLIKGTDSGNISIGTTAGGDEIGTIELTADQWVSLRIDIFPGTPVYFSSFPGTVQIIIYKRNISI